MIRWIILLIVVLLVLSYFGFSLRNLIDQPVTQDNFSYVTTNSVSIWDQYLKQPATYSWNNIFVDLIWDPAIHNLEQMKNGQPTNVATATPTLPPLPSPIH